jgi:hypothetical protein
MEPFVLEEHQRSEVYLTNMSTESKDASRVILASIAVQIVAWVALALLVTLVGGHQIRIWVAIQIVWPILVTVYWSRDPALRRLAVIINVLYGFMAGTGVAASVMACIDEASWLTMGQLLLLITISSTYVLNAFALKKLNGSTPAAEVRSEN